MAERGTRGKSYVDTVFSDGTSPPFLMRGPLCRGPGSITGVVGPTFFFFLIKKIEDGWALPPLGSLQKRGTVWIVHFYTASMCNVKIFVVVDFALRGTFVGPIRMELSSCFFYDFLGKWDGIISFLES